MELFRIKSAESKLFLLRWLESGNEIEWSVLPAFEPKGTISTSSRIIEACLTEGEDPLLILLTKNAIEGWSLKQADKLWSVSIESLQYYEFPHSWRPPQYLALSPDGKWIAFREKSGNLHLISASSGNVKVFSVGTAEDQLSPHDWNDGMMFSHDSHWLYLGHSHGFDAFDLDKKSVGYKISSTASGCRVQRNAFMHPLAISPDNKQLFLLMDYQSICMFDVKQQRSTYSVDRVMFKSLLEQGVNWPFTVPKDAVETWDRALDEVAISADAALISFYTPTFNRLFTVDGRSGELLREICPFRCRGLTRPTFRYLGLSPDGQILLVSSSSFGHAAWSTKTGEFLYALTDPSRPIK